MIPVGWSVALDIGVTTVLGVGLTLARRTLFATPASRRTTISSVICFLGMIVADLVTLSLGRNTAEASVHSMTAGMLLIALVAATELRELWAAVAVHALAVFTIIVWPGFASPVVVTTIAVDTMVFALAFRRMATRSSDATRV